MLFAHRSTGEDMRNAVSINGRPYTDLPNAFRYRQEHNPACTCKRPGESWTEAVKEDQTLAHGDIVVTEGVHAVRNGAPVTIARTDAPRQTAPAETAATSTSGT